MSRNDLKRILYLALTTLPYVTPAKLRNLLLCELEIGRRTVRQASMPYVSLVDVTDLCNLRCPYCPTGRNQDSGRPVRTIDLEVMERFVDEMASSLISINLFNWGEPFLHPQIAAIVSMCHRRNLSVTVSSNLSVRFTDRILAACESGMDYLIVSLSGATQETYGEYHRGGHLDRVIANTRAIIDWRRKKGSRRPYIEWKYLIFKYNVDEVSACEDLARKLGVDIFRVKTGGGPVEVCVGDDQDPAAPTCPELWRMAVLSADGGVPGCCYLYWKKDDFGEFPQKTIAQTRANEKFILARRLFNPAESSLLTASLDHPCLKCYRVHNQTHLKHLLEGNSRAAEGHRTGAPYPYQKRVGGTDRGP